MELEKARYTTSALGSVCYSTAYIEVSLNVVIAYGVHVFVNAYRAITGYWLWLCHLLAFVAGGQMQRGTLHACEFLFLQSPERKMLFICFYLYVTQFNRKQHVWQAHHSNQTLLQCTCRLPTMQYHRYHMKSRGICKTVNSADN